jgi:small subunit ribosomal protein S4
LIVHGHIAIAGRRITSPGYIVSRDEENLIGFYYKSPLAHKAIALQEEGS